MLAKFKVENFKGFRIPIELNFCSSKGYTFNQSSVNNGVLKNIIIYGENGVGKSNLGLGIFDIVAHLTEKNINERQYLHYVNAYSSDLEVTFEYEFVFNGTKVYYKYVKSGLRDILSEELLIDDAICAQIDRRISNQAFINLKGAESLNKGLPGTQLSLLKYIKNNSVLENDHSNRVFAEFYEFVEKMLFFRSVDNNMYLGYQEGSRSIGLDIIERGNVKDLQDFLCRAGIKCEIDVAEDVDKKVLVFKFDGKFIGFFDIASTGTKSLTLFYYWLQRIRTKNEISFVFIDEFDAFYHFELSAFIVNELKNIGVQFILTTHNTTIMSNDLLRPDSYFIMSKSVIKNIPQSTEKEIREAHNLEKMYRSGSFNE